MLEEKDTGEAPEKQVVKVDDGGETPTLEQLTAELTRTREALKKANSEAAERRVKLQEIEEQEAERAKAEMSEIEKAQAEAKEAADALAQLKESTRSSAIRHAVEMAAAKANFTDPSDAYKLADLSSVDVGDDGTVAGVDEAIKALAESKPYMVKSERAPLSDINASKRGKQTASNAGVDYLKKAYGPKKDN